jgi:hypothetical protein
MRRTEGARPSRAIEILRAQDQRLRTEVANRCGLDADSRLVGILTCFSERERIRLMSDMELLTANIFGDEYRKRILVQIYKALDHDAFVGRIKKESDFRRYANIVMDFGRTCLWKTTHLEEISGQEEVVAHLSRMTDNALSSVRVVAHLSRMTDNALSSVRDDFERDLAAMSQLARMGPRWLLAMRGIGGLIKTSADLARFVKFAQENPYRSFNILFGTREYYHPGRWNRLPVFGVESVVPDDVTEDECAKMPADDPAVIRYHDWQGAFADGVTFDAALSLLEAGLREGIDHSNIVNTKLGRRFLRESTPGEINHLNDELSRHSLKALDVFSSHDRTVGEVIADRISSAISLDEFGARVATPEDFSRYACGLVDAAALFLRSREYGDYFQPDADDLVYVKNRITDTVRNIAALTRESFERAFRISVRLLCDCPYVARLGSGVFTILDVLRRIDWMIGTSADLERFGSFVRVLSKHECDIDDAFNSLLRLGETPVSREQLDAMLSTMEASIAAGEKNIGSFVSNLIRVFGSTDSEENFWRNVRDIQRLSTKGINPNFIVERALPLSHYDLSKDGLAALTSVELKRSALEYYDAKLFTHPAGVEAFAKLFNEALDPNSADPELREFAAGLLRLRLEETFRHGPFELIGAIRSNIPESARMIGDLDEAGARDIQKMNFTRQFSFLGSEAADLFPDTSDKAREFIFAKLGSDVDFADYFVEKLADYHENDWFPECIAKALRHVSVANKFLAHYKHGRPSWRDARWAYAAWQLAEETVDVFSNDRQGLSESIRSSVTPGFSTADKCASRPALRTLCAAGPTRGNWRGLALTPRRRARCSRWRIKPSRTRTNDFLNVSVRIRIWGRMTSGRCSIRGADG